MPPIRLSASEASSLRKISYRPCLKTELPDDHSAKLLNYGLACREAMAVRITPRGQVELLASRFQIAIPSARAIRQKLRDASLARFRRDLD
jgi:hypothetical protein